MEYKNNVLVTCTVLGTCTVTITNTVLSTCTNLLCTILPIRFCFCKQLRVKKKNSKGHHCKQQTDNPIYKKLCFRNLLIVIPQSKLCAIDGKSPFYV